jgi:hypothetical protein
MNKTMGSLVVTLFVGLGLSTGSANADFSGAYDVSKWTKFSSDGHAYAGFVAGTDGIIDTSGAPASIMLTSSNNATEFIIPTDEGPIEGSTFHPSDQDFTITAVAESDISFNWDWETSDFSYYSDPFGFLLNGNFTWVTTDTANFDNSQSGVFSHHVNAGDTFGFRAHSLTSFDGAASTTISNFNVTVVPEPAAYAMFVAGLGLMGMVLRRNDKHSYQKSLDT